MVGSLIIPYPNTDTSSPVLGFLRMVIDPFISFDTEVVPPLSDMLLSELLHPATVNADTAAVAVAIPIKSRLFILSI
jgi:hypothetical protein